MRVMANVGFNVVGIVVGTIDAGNCAGNCIAK